jgi:hypothetical protein
VQLWAAGTLIYSFMVILFLVYWGIRLEILREIWYIGNWKGKPEKRPTLSIA